MFVVKKCTLHFVLSIPGKLAESCCLPFHLLYIMEIVFMRLLRSEVLLFFAFTLSPDE
jgi:hypothetical protein